MTDPIIDRSPEQRLIRLDKMRAELALLGYSVVKTDWLHMAFDLVRDRNVLESAE